MNRKAQVDVQDSAESNHHHQQLLQQIAEVTYDRTPMHYPLEGEAVEVLEHVDDVKVHGDVHNNKRANEGLKVRIETKTISGAAVPTTATATVTPDGLLPCDKEYSDESIAKQFDQRRRNAVTMSENTTGIRVDAKSLEDSNRPANQSIVAVAASIPSNLKQTHVRDVFDSITSTIQQRTAPRDQISRGGPKASNDNITITSETRRTHIPGGERSQNSRGEMLLPAFNSSRMASDVCNAHVLPPQVAPSHTRDAASVANADLHAQLLRPQVAPFNAEEDDDDEEENVANVAQHLDPARSAAAAAIEIDDILDTEHMVPEPRSKDILLGRGPACYSHQGNQQFRMLINSFRHLYRNQVPRREKALLVHRIVSQILQGGGRFLQERSGMWYEVPPHVARKKVGHALRDARLRQYELDLHLAAEESRRGSANSSSR
jgi:hypothetical protein